jgi:radical SAM superfamily enzyme YgiQ (UPF0313 family)
MTPLRVYLCDLTHETVILVSDTIPINLGYIGAYAKKNYGNSIEVSLFKYPKDAIDAIKKNPPDVLGLSNYSWNSLLSERIANIAKLKNPKVVTVQGGPNFPHGTEQQLEFLNKRPNTDLHIMFEGEATFSNLLDRVLKDRKGEQKLFDSPINGCVFIHPDKQKVLVRGLKPPRIKFLDDIPSPYLTGMLDNFFDGKLSPFIETSRGCPFKCAFCHTGNDYYQKVHMFSIKRIQAELEYIAVRASRQKNTILHLADVNFGMFPRDRKICEFLVLMQKKYKWPSSIVSTTGKNNKKRIIEATSILGDTFYVSMSAQSMDDKVLNNIKRSNIKLDHFTEINKYVQDQGRSTAGELIIGLPGETKSSFIKGVKQIIESWVSRITIYTLMMLHGTEFKDPKYRDSFGMKGKFRIVPLNLGNYDGVKVFDYEEVCVETKDMSFNDYLYIRQFCLAIETVFNNQPFEVFFRYALTLGVSRFYFLLRIFNNIRKAPKKIIDIFNEFKQESQEELWESEIELIKHYQKYENYQKLVKGDAGGNLIYKYKSKNLVTAMPEWTKYLAALLEDLTIEKIQKNSKFSIEQIKLKQQEIDALAKYHNNQTWKFLDGESSEENVTMESKYDFLAWLKAQKPQHLSEYRVKNPIRYFFGYTKKQKKERYDQFRRYGTDINALSKIVVRIKAENWLRSVGTNPGFIKDNFDTKRSRTRYAMST